jgi:hypothetical protein
MGFELVREIECVDGGDVCKVCAHGYTAHFYD